MRPSRFLALFILLGMLIGVGDRPALAHAVLVETTPANDSVLAETPRAIALRFNEPVTPIALSIIGQGGSRALAPTIRDDRITAAVPSDLASGSYLVSYRVVSADSHPISGAFLFTVGAPSGKAPLAPDLREREAVWSLLVALNRLALLAGLAFAAGGALFAAVVLRRGEPLLDSLRQPLRIGALIALTNAVLAVPLQGGLLTAAPFGSAATWLHGEIFLTGWRSNLGASAALIGLGLLAVAAGAAVPRRPWLTVGVAGAILAASALAVSGHAATASPRWLAALALASHALAMSFWVGSLWPLLRVLRLPHDQAAFIIRRFSRLAGGAVILLMVAGLILATLQLDGDAVALVTTAYGQLLLLKPALVAAVLLLALHNKRRLTPALARNESVAANRLAHAIRLEIAAMITILAVTALLGQTPPPRAIALTDRSVAAIHGPHGNHGIVLPASATVEQNGIVATATLTPARVGRNALSVTLRNSDGAALAALEARAEFALPSAAIEPLALALSSTAPGHYAATTDALIVAGTWQLRLIVLIDDFEQMSFDFVLTVR